MHRINYCKYHNEGVYSSKKLRQAQLINQNQSVLVFVYLFIFLFIYAKEKDILLLLLLRAQLKEALIDLQIQKNEVLIEVKTKQTSTLACKRECVFKVLNIQANGDTKPINNTQINTQKYHIKFKVVLRRMYFSRGYGFFVLFQQTESIKNQTPSCSLSLSSSLSFQSSHSLLSPLFSHFLYLFISLILINIIIFLITSVLAPVKIPFYSINLNHHQFLQNYLFFPLYKIHISFKIAFISKNNPSFPR
ncbi:transmembrane protein, putative (macronuclear) [Tetrahymena thermophila SB210]|uniref:Transmembrane protein, putative n=1 Tax=Tetrahymena thermophila (strain SB210) TaxID=312017 RepID=W7XFV5_TETTS|nr:transmembrane protein, putative [Tetrahymena thermophila SB210]EWS72911.1 transmembrane protein, putative [Tetrahymena thermophila SB210]|eukprot:XP_012654551.1 transmembrane protein, putative [Tetrahymena thermophila SB210]